MQMVDDGKLKTTPAVELSYLTPEEQEDFLSYMESEGCTPSLSQAQKLFFPKGFSSEQMQKVIVHLLENYARAHQHGSR